MHRQTALTPVAPEHPAEQPAGTARIDGVSLLGVSVTVIVVIDLAEHERRRSSECTAVTDPALLDRLLGLALGAPVADPVTWAETADQPSSVVVRGADGFTVTRCLAKPLSIKDVIVTAPIGRELRAVQEVSMFARFARRWVMTTRNKLSESVLLEAKLCGVGVLGASGSTLLAAEAPFSEASDAWDWMLCEQVYRRWLSQSSRNRAMANPAQSTAEAIARQAS